MPKKIILVRHGQTDENLNRTVQGWMDTVLNEVGKSQAEKLVGRFGESEKIDEVFSSDSKRARKTVEGIAKKFNLELKLRIELRERNFGSFEGKTWDEIEKAMPFDYSESRNEKNKMWAKHGIEPIESFQKRLKTFINYLAKHYKNKNVVVGLHGGSKRNILRIMGLVDENEMTRFNNASVTILEKQMDGSYKTLEFNDVGHLE